MVAPITITVLGSALLYLVDRAREKRQATAAVRADVPPDPPEFTRAQIERFTHVMGQERHFDRALSDAMPEVLKSYSAIPVDIPELREHGRVWSVVPRIPGAEIASDLLAALRRDPTATMLGSLTLSLPLRIAVPRLIFVGGPGMGERFAPLAGSPFAVISRPVEKPVVTEPVPQAKPAAPPAPEPEPEIILPPVIVAVSEVTETPASNGASKRVYSRPIVRDISPKNEPVGD